MFQLIFIWTFCILSNVHFLLAHCHDFDYEYFIEYVQHVWVKFLVVDGTAIIMSVFMLFRTMIYLIRSNNTDRLLLQHETTGYILMLMAFTAPLIVDALCAYAEPNMSLTVHRILTVSVREVSYCSVPALLAKFRPLSRSDFHSLIDAVKSCISGNFNRISAASQRRFSQVRWSSIRDPIVNAANSGMGNIRHESHQNRGVDNDQVQILSLCQEDTTTGLEDGL